MVAIGVAIDKMFADVAAKVWRKYSRDFCEVTHIEWSSGVRKLVVLRILLVSSSPSPARMYGKLGAWQPALRKST